MPLHYLVLYLYLVPHSLQLLARSPKGLRTSRKSQVARVLRLAPHHRESQMVFELDRNSEAEAATWMRIVHRVQLLVPLYNTPVLYDPRSEIVDLVWRAAPICSISVCRRIVALWYSGTSAKFIGGNMRNCGIKEKMSSEKWQWLRHRVKVFVVLLSRSRRNPELPLVLQYCIHIDYYGYCLFFR
jgi:hypothetical protein